MQKYINNVQDTFGNAVGSVTVTIRTNPGGIIASIFSDNSGTVKANPFTNDPDGEFFFYAADGRYDIELTGPITETKSDVRLLDVLTTGTTLRINTDINTASPPTSEAVSGTYDIYDLANDDRLARFGFESGHTLFLTNFMRGGPVKINAANNAGVFKTIIEGDPDGATSIYHGGTLKISTVLDGAVIRSTTSTDAENRILDFAYQDGTSRAVVGFFSTTSLLLRNRIHGGNIQIQAEDSGGTIRQILTGDPDGVTNIIADTNIELQVSAGELALKGTANSSTSLYYDGINRVATGSLGALNIYSDDSLDTSQRRVEFRHADGALRGYMGYINSSELLLANTILGGNITLRGKDAGGTLRTILTGDPDGITQLRADTNLELQCAASETALLATANVDVALFYNNVETFRTASRTVSDQISGAEVQDAQGNFRPVGLGTSAEIALSGTGTQTYFSQGRCGGTIYWAGGSATNLDTYPNTGTDQTNIPNGAWWIVQNNGAGALTIRGGSGITIRYWSGAGAAPANVDVSIPRGSQVMIRKVNDSFYDISHNGA